jgi:hypothetical protein
MPRQLHSRPRPWMLVAIVALVLVSGCSSAASQHALPASETTAANSPTNAASSDWSAFTAAVDTDGRLTRTLVVQSPGALRLEPVPLDTSPPVGANQARSQIGTWLDDGGSVKATLALASVTTTGWGEPLPNGGFDPAVDRQTAWVAWLTGVDLTSQYRGPGPIPTGNMIGQMIVLVDANTGQVLDTMSGP